VTARHRREREMLQRLWVATIEEIKLKKEKKKKKKKKKKRKRKRKRFAIECKVIEIVCWLPRQDGASSDAAGQRADAALVDQSKDVRRCGGLVDKT
jgi:hypothetical protein